ncbi:MAG: hypothetical protein ABIR92_00975 [Gemmatimonadaceae bacterium]
MTDAGLAAADEDAAERKEKDHGMSPLEGLRASDIEPYTGLRYLSKLFRFMAVVLLLVLVAEIATGLYTQGAAAIPTLLGEASRLVVLAGVLWGTGDLAHLLIDVGHDVRAGRILMARGAAGGVQFMPRDRATQARALREGGVIAAGVLASRSNAGNASERPADRAEPPIP